MITGWLSPEDCPDCGGPLLDISENGQFLILACPGCGYSITWHATEPDDGTTPELDDPYPTDPGPLEAE